MAPRLGSKAAPNVTQFPTRAAKGAGKSKPAKPAAKLKPAVPAGRPQLKSEDKLRESLKLQIVGYTAQHRGCDEQLAVLKEEVKAINQRKKQIRTAIQTAGMPLKLFDESYEDAGTSRVDLERKEKLRRIVREAHGLMVEAQADLLEKLPEGARGAVYWEAQGYQDGIAGKFADAGAADCPPEHKNDYLRGHGNAMEINAKGIKAVKAAEAASSGKDVPGQTDVIPEDPDTAANEHEDDDSDRDEPSELEKLVESGQADPGEREAAPDAPDAPELEGAPPTEPTAEPVLH
jgi:ribosome modulation factor